MTTRATLGTSIRATPTFRSVLAQAVTVDLVVMTSSIRTTSTFLCSDFIGYHFKSSLEILLPHFAGHAHLLRGLFDAF